MGYLVHRTAFAWEMGPTWDENCKGWDGVGQEVADGRTALLVWEVADGRTALLVWEVADGRTA
jgi:hypothetical protein